MKKKYISQSAFFNIRVLVGLFIALTGVSLLALGALATANPAGRGAPPQRAASATQSNYDPRKAPKLDPLVPVMFDCSKIRQFGIDKQENMRAGAIMIFCGQAKGGDPDGGMADSNAFSKLVHQLTAPLAYGGTDVDLITGTETSPNITQSETYSLASPEDASRVLVAYNDSRGRNFSPINISGASFSSDGGLTFTRLTKANGQSPFDNTLGDPVILYNSTTHTWFTVWLDAGCGGQGLGGYKTTTPGDPNSWTHFCVHTNSQDDRESGWSDNNPSSPFVGRMYVSWNDFNVGGGALFVTYSSDNGATWHSPIQVNPSFVRDVQITGDLVTGDVYIAAMNENGGNSNFNRNNLFYRSTDGGNSWTNTYTGPTFSGPHRTNSGYFACMYSSPAYWRHMGWGEPAAYNHVVSYVYSAANTGNGDPGDIFYIRSTDSGVTFSAPTQLNTDTDHTKAQWQANLSVSNAGTLFATWYDETPRVAASCQPSSPGTPCYQMYSRKSNDNGVTWLAPDTLSDVASPLPLQPDPGIQALYVGDYDYGSAVLTKHVTSWVDGRVIISGQSQQDAFTDRELVGFAVTTTNPACGSFVVGTAPTAFVINLSDAVAPATVQASDFTVNGTPANTFTLSNGNTTIEFDFTSSPVTAGQNTMHIPAGAFLRASDNQPVFEFNCTFRFAAVQLTVTDTNPPVGGTFSGPGTADFDVNWNIAVDPPSVQTSDLQVSGVTGTTVTNVQVMNGNMTTRFTLNFTSIVSGTLTASIPAGAINDASGNPNAAFSGNYNYNGNFCPTLTENFDSVTPPALPPNWVATNVIDPDGILWQSSNSGTPSPPADSLPNAAWVNDAGSLADKRLTSLTLTYGAGAQLTFTANYDLEQQDGTTAYDNGLLEISFDNGSTFQEFVAAGGSFVTGGYNHTAISTGFQNPCMQQYGPNQANWSGISNGGSGGFETTTALLPASGVGQNVKIRWRECSDASVSHAGWRVDNVTIFEPCGSPTPTPTPGTPTPTPTPGTPTPTPTPGTPTPTPTPGTPTPTPTPGTPTPTPTPGTPTPTPTPTATPAHSATPRPHPTPHPRPTPH
jgi:hypothetical protein